jgi:hypothetical protein
MMLSDISRQQKHSSRKIPVRGQMHSGHYYGCARRKGEKGVEGFAKGVSNEISVIIIQVLIPKVKTARS